jgi:hypothetical protein
MGTAEVESALVAHQEVSEAAVVGFPHDIKGQGIYAYVTLMTGTEPTGDLRKELVAWVRKEIGPIAAPDVIQFAPGLPKTRSGKIMRRILRKIAENEVDALGDYINACRSGGRLGSDQEPAAAEGPAEMNLDAISIGDNPPDDVNVIVEVPIGGEPIKYEMIRPPERYLSIASCIRRCAIRGTTASCPILCQMTAIRSTSWWQTRGPSCRGQ